MGILREFSEALKGQFQSAGIRSSAGPTSGITRTRIYSGACWLNAITVMPDYSGVPSTISFWSIDDSNVSASGSAGSAVVGSYFAVATGAANSGTYTQHFPRGLALDNGLTFNYTATGTGLALRYSVWYTAKKEPVI